jgi:HlyD family secretion protein
MTPATDSSDVAQAHASMQRALIAGVVVLVLLIFGLMRWAALTEITGAVIAEGTVVVESSLKKIQHPTGGTVKEVRVKNGDRIKAGDVLIRLDGIEIQNRLKLLERQLLAHRLRIARLTAERNNQASITLAGETASRASDPAIADMITNETGLFASRRAIREGQRAELNQRILQLRNEIAGFVGQGRDPPYRRGAAPLGRFRDQAERAGHGDPRFRPRSA